MYRTDPLILIINAIADVQLVKLLGILVSDVDGLQCISFGTKVTTTTLNLTEIDILFHELIELEEKKGVIAYKFVSYLQ